jgi:hypothetical protein
MALFDRNFGNRDHQARSHFIRFFDLSEILKAKTSSTAANLLLFSSGRSR